MSITAPSLETATPAARKAARVAADLILELGLAPITDIEPAPFAGRNGTWVMTLADESKIFVKQLFPHTASPQAFARSVAFAHFAGLQRDHAPASPALLASDADTGVLVFEHCPGTGLAHLVVEEKVPQAFPQQAGALLARLHSAPAQGLEATTIASPPIQLLRLGVPHTRFLDFTLAEMRLWSTLQSDADLLAAAEDLHRNEIANQSRPIHADLRLDQFHLHEGELRLLDWEEFGLGDPARDLGMLAGEWVYRAVLDTVTTRGNNIAPPEVFTEHSATEHIANQLNRAIPQVRSLWDSYLANGARPDAQLAVRATAQLGWHLVDRAITRASMVSRLSGIERAAAGIGRKALLDPQGFCASLGFERSTP